MTQTIQGLKPVDWLTRSLAQWPGGLPQERSEEFSALLQQLAELLADGSPIWQRLPRVIQEIFGARGWGWNGIYVREGHQLNLADGAAGPLVCATLLLVEGGSVGSSGCCWDALLMNQTIVMDDVKQWPGYVSCDGESRLQTVSGIVCPIRDADHRPIAVWDLDSQQRLEPEDGVFMSRVWDTLSIALKPTPKDLTRSATRAAP